MSDLLPGQVRVTCEDDLGDPESVVITDDYVVVCAGNRYVESVSKPVNGTVTVVIKTS